MALFVPDQEGQIPTRKEDFSGEYMMKFPQVFKDSSGKKTFDPSLSQRRQVLMTDLDK